VFGDCRGKTAQSWLSAEAVAVARRSGFEAGLNDPFAGGHVIERHAQPRGGIHALQLEIDRRCYLDERLVKPGPGFDSVAALIETLTVELGQALIGRQYATAAE
jgi:N-formylglutamate amidohydrolase